LATLRANLAAALTVLANAIDIQLRAGSTVADIIIYSPTQATKDALLPLIIALVATNQQMEQLLITAGITNAMVAGPVLIDGVCYPCLGLSTCNCNAFFDGLTSDSVGGHACAKQEVLGLNGVATICRPPERPLIPFVDDGCPSDMVRCIVNYVAPVHPSCVCDSYGRGASASSLALCQKDTAHGERVCYPRNYDGDKKIGSAEYFGCASDMVRCNT